MKNITLCFRLNEEQTFALTKAQKVLEDILDMLDELSDNTDESCTFEVASYDGMPYVNENIDKAWEALYQLNFETAKGEKYEFTCN